MKSKRVNGFEADCLLDHLQFVHIETWGLNSVGYPKSNPQPIINNVVFFFFRITSNAKGQCGLGALSVLYYYYYTYLSYSRRSLALIWPYWLSGHKTPSYLLQTVSFFAEDDRSDRGHSRHSPVALSKVTSSQRGSVLLLFTRHSRPERAVKDTLPGRPEPFMCLDLALDR